eukprot:5841759-Pleurochrysis_carterae.AAC.1
MARLLRTRFESQVLESRCIYEASIAELAFPKLKVKHKPLVPKLQSGDIDLNNRGQDLTPEEWATMLADKTKPKVVSARPSSVRSTRDDYFWSFLRSLS